MMYNADDFQGKGEVKMWYCPRCQSACEGSSCNKCGYKNDDKNVNGEKDNLQIEKLFKTVKMLKVVCIILAIALVAVTVAGALGFAKVFQNSGEIWQNIDAIWENLYE